MDLIDQRLTPMPDYMKAQVIETWKNISLKTELESKFATNKLMQSQIYNTLARNYRTDTIFEEIALDSILHLHTRRRKILSNDC
jgi:hypothetical protein